LGKALTATRRKRGKSDPLPSAPAAKPESASEGLRKIAKNQTDLGLAGEAKARESVAPAVPASVQNAINASRRKRGLPPLESAPAPAAPAAPAATTPAAPATKGRDTAKKEYWTSPDGKTTAPLLGKTPDERASEIAAYNKLHAEG
jgi:hypothetical protein